MNKYHCSRMIGRLRYIERMRIRSFMLQLIIGVDSMATTKDYKDFILEQLNLLDNITCKSMMGEYLLYYNGLLFGGIYDDRLLVKIVDNNKKYNMRESIPYKNAKSMYLVDDVDNQEILKDIVLDTCKDLK